MVAIYKRRWGHSRALSIENAHAEVPDMMPVKAAARDCGTSAILARIRIRPRDLLA